MASGLHVVTAGEKPPATTWNDYITKQVVQIYATATDRNTQTSGQKREGMLFYRADGRVLELSRSAVSGEVSTLGPAHGALLTWVPVITQGAVPTFTNGASTYCRWGRMIIGKFICTITGTPGTAANIVVVSLPVAAATSDSLTYVGVGRIADSSANSHYGARLCMASTTQVQFDVSTTGTFNVLGTTSFTAALASGDNVVGNFYYEAAADA